MVDIFDVDLAGNTLDGTPGALSATVGGIGTITDVTAGDTTNTITFTAVDGSSSYNLYWDTTAGVAITDNQITGVTSPYTHTGRSNGTEYFYVYTAIIDSVETEISNELSGTPAAPAPPYPVLFALRA